jgi:hypothetical protein
MAELDDPRVFPDAAAATEESARLHALAAASQAATGREAAALDEQLASLLTTLLAPGSGEHLAAVFATAPSAAVYRHLWRLLVQCERNRATADALGVTVFALPVILVAGMDGERPARVTLSGVLDDAAALVAILREHGALAGNQTFALANVLVAAGAIDFSRLPDLLAWRGLSETPTSARALEPAPIMLSPGAETVYLRFLLGSAIAAPDTDLLGEGGVGKWGIPFTQALGRQLAAPGVSVLALPRAPQSLLNAAQQGQFAQREVGAHIFASNAIRKLRAAVGEPTAVISTHRSAAAQGGGEVRLSLASPFDPHAAEGFRCPLYPLDRVGDVVAMLKDLLDECRVADVRIVPGVHGDRDPSTGLPLLFKGDDVPWTATH